MHPWDLTPEQAIRLQESLRGVVVVQPRSLQGLRLVAGVDVSFPREQARAAIVVLSFPSLVIVDQAAAEVPAHFPYIPGLLSFREIPAILKALEQLSARPDVLICDGHGLAHPRRFGLACHLGLLLDWPVLGCAKSILVGSHAGLGAAQGSTADLMDGEDVIGAAVRTRQAVRPVYVSIGHRIDLPSSIELVLACCRGFRLPEPARLAHHLASGREVGPP
jgi:deoxyribonuclease V